MLAVEINEIHKSFGDVKAVDGVTFNVKKGEIFGLLGPNGAGKTTSIRIILDIFKPDRGVVSVLGGPMTEKKKARIGYMPEERGLYQDIALARCLVYLGTLKGLSTSEAKSRVDVLLDKFDLSNNKKNKVKELSKGMQQKAQIIATIMHEPELIIIDEPFTSLDPVNTQMVKSLMRELRHKGTTIIMCTHQMHQVEELCDRILLINKGSDVLYGNLEEIRRRYSGHAVIVQAQSEIPAVQGVQNVESFNGGHKLYLDDGVAPQQILNSLVSHNIILEKFEIAIPALDEIFIHIVEEGETE
jgi:ABC-2 type transport system ATP-binding protein